MVTAAHRRLLATAASLVVVALPGAAVGSSATTDRTPVVEQGGLAFAAVPPAARSHVLTTIAGVRASARVVLAQIDPAILFDLDPTRCRSADVSCSYPSPAGAARPWSIHLQPSAAADVDPSQRFTVLHELGHAVWSMVFTPADRQAFGSGVDRALAGRSCRGWRLGRPCASMPEMFADEFARWAGGFAVSMTGYETPALFTAAQFDALVGTASARRPGAAL
jgi:hypothetical protein